MLHRRGNEYYGEPLSPCVGIFVHIPCDSPSTRAHNNSNILCLGGKITGVMEVLAI